ncbi:solute carrier family 2, facilitated glucose transporter member 8-like isoform X2 [Macrobrachium nipponense]|uniref:solute carrier family 2, facilitated glucose transporter member 8-like isoform X2 n=1 Tax=Macrobrachium nipponense TaxID=159736 RepID=UPI0030C7BE09
MEGGGAHLGTEPKKKPSQRTQIFSALSATLAGLAHGTVTTYTSPAGPKLQNPVSPLDGDLRLSKLEYDFFSSSICLAGAVGALCFGYVMNKWGRKISLMVTAAVITIGFAMIAAGPNFPVLMIGRLLTGFGQGGALLTVPSYIGEIVAPNIRGALGEECDINDEFDKMEKFVEELKQNRGSFKDLLLPHNFKPAAICFMVLFLDQASGIMPLLLNLRTIFTEASASVSDDLSSIITGIVQCLACVFSVFVIDKTGRKPLLIMSSAVMCLSLVALGDYFYLKEESSEWARATLGWLPLTCLVLFMSAMNGGFFPVLYVLMGELITPEARGIAGGIAIMLSSVSGFAVSITFHPMQEAMGMYGVYWFYGSMCFGALLFAVVVVPETKGKTMQQIASYFNNPAA